MIRFQCPTCGKRVKVADRFGGQTGECPRCKLTCTIPAAPKVSLLKRLAGRLRPARFEPAEVAKLKSSIGSQAVAKSVSQAAGCLMVIVGVLVVVMVFAWATNSRPRDPVPTYFGSSGPSYQTPAPVEPAHGESSPSNGPVQVRGYSKTEAQIIYGRATLNPWFLQVAPFQNEYPGARIWNRNAVRLRFQPAVYGSEVLHPTWNQITAHVGQTLDSIFSPPAPAEPPTWARDASILTGSDYLQAWMASILRYPFEPLPYLFLYGPENSGKSIFWEAFDLLVTCGVVKADRVLTCSSGFNGELVGAILCAVEERDVSKGDGHNKIRDYVTGRQLSIRKMRTDSFMVPNTTHWVQMANNVNACPIFPGDTRITVCYVPPLATGAEIPKTELLERLALETPSFLRTLLDLTLPAPQGRLRIPIVETQLKTNAAAENDDVACFFAECLRFKPDATLAKSAIYDAYARWCDATYRAALSPVSFGKRLAPFVITLPRPKIYLNGRRHEAYAGIDLAAEYILQA